MNQIDYFSYINYDACDNGAYNTTQDHSIQKKHLRQNYQSVTTPEGHPRVIDADSLTFRLSSHDSWRHSYQSNASSASDPIFKDRSSTYPSQPPSINPTMISGPLYETAPSSSLEYDYAPLQATNKLCYPMPRGISPSSSDSSIRSMDPWFLHNMSSMSSPASSISSRRPSPIPEPHPHSSTHSTKASHLRVQTGSVSIHQSIVSPRHAKRAIPYPDSSEDGTNSKKKWPCQYCGKKFTRDSDRKRHCDESTSCRKKLKHYDESDDNIKFACEYCQKPFCRQDSLERHRKNPSACIARPKARH